MKKIASYFIKTLLLFLLFISCNEEKKEVLKTEVKPPKQIITTDKAQAMFDNYTNRRAPLIQKYEDSVNPKERFDVARYGYYDYKTIKDYMAFIEQEAKKADVEISTLRFYFSNYANDATAKHPRQNSFFIIPTTKAAGKNYGFSVVSDDNGNYKAKLLKGNFIIKKEGISTDRVKSDASFAPFFTNNLNSAPPGDEESLILNDSNVVPPPYGEQ